MIILNAPIKLNSPDVIDHDYKKIVDGVAIPWPSLAEINASMVYRSVGKTFLVATEDGNKECWYKENITDSGLVMKESDSMINANDYFDDGGTAKTTIAGRVGDTLYNLLDDYTGEAVTFTKVAGVTDADVDSVIIRKKGSEYFKRVFVTVRPEWFGLDGVNDQVAINKAFNANKGGPVIVDFEANKTYTTSAPILLTKGQVLNGNKAKISSTSTTAIIKGRDELLSNIFQHTGAIINDITLLSATAKEGINLKGFTHSKVINASIEITNVIEDSTFGIRLQHGALNYEQCYFNEIVNPRIYLDGLGIGILIDGVDGVSGANVNTISGGVVTGRDKHALKIKNNSTGNIIYNLDAEHFNPTATTSAISIESSLNTILGAHVENYDTCISISGNSNTVQGFSGAAFLDIYNDSGSDNIYEGVNTTGSGGLSIGADNNFGQHTKFRISGTTFPSIRIDSKNSSSDSRNWALRAGFTGNEFDFMRSDAKGGDPVLSGTPMWSINPQGHFVLPQQIKLPNISNYSSNTAAVNDGWTAGFFYATPDGIVRVVKPGGVTEPTLPNETDPLAVKLTGDQIIEGIKTFNSATTNFISTADATDIRVGQNGSANGVRMKWNNNSATGSLLMEGSSNWDLRIGNTTNYTQFKGNGDVVVPAAITTGAPTGGTAAAWKLGGIESNIARVNIGGTDTLLSLSARGVVAGYREVSAATTVLITDYTINVTAGTFSQPLPTTELTTGQIINIKNSGAGTVTLTATSIDGQTTLDLITGESIKLQYTGTSGSYIII